MPWKSQILLHLELVACNMPITIPWLLHPLLPKDSLALFLLVNAWVNMMVMMQTETFHFPSASVLVLGLVVCLEEVLSSNEVFLSVLTWLWMVVNLVNSENQWEKQMQWVVPHHLCCCVCCCCRLLWWMTRGEWNQSLFPLHRWCQNVAISVVNLISMLHQPNFRDGLHSFPTVSDALVWVTMLVCCCIYDHWCWT